MREDCENNGNHVLMTKQTRSSDSRMQFWNSCSTYKHKVVGIGLDNRISKFMQQHGQKVVGIGFDNRSSKFMQQCRLEVVDQWLDTIAKSKFRQHRMQPMNSQCNFEFHLVIKDEKL